MTDKLSNRQIDAMIAQHVFGCKPKFVEHWASMNNNKTKGKIV